jgi:hypothetical protein
MIRPDRAHWGEDGMAGISDAKQFLCFSEALRNGNDPILKERMFGLTNSEGNHGEDVKEYYFYLDSTRGDMEYKLLDTGIFNEDRYFDVFVEYARSRPRTSSYRSV